MVVCPRCGKCTAPNEKPVTVSLGTRRVAAACAPGGRFVEVSQVTGQAQIHRACLKNGDVIL